MCDKPTVKCGECPNQAFAPLTEKTIHDHFQGRHVIGVYPMLADETCWFLAVDFDKGQWQKDVTAFVETCKSKGVLFAVERSRSGNAAHVWFFFAAPVPASVARKMGWFLITLNGLRAAYATSSSCRVARRPRTATLPSSDSQPYPIPRRLVLATGRFVGEGFDDARLDTPFLAMPVSWKGTLVQYAGRLHRKHHTKTEVRNVDYVDRNVPMLTTMFEKRIRGYRAIGYRFR